MNTPMTATEGNMRKLHLFWAMLVLTLFTLLVGILCYQVGYKRGKFDHLLRILD